MVEPGQAQVCLMPTVPWTLHLQGMGGERSC